MDKIEKVFEFLILGAGAFMFYYVSRNVSNQMKDKRRDDRLSEESRKPPMKKILIVGPEQCGKTSIMMKLFNPNNYELTDHTATTNCYKVFIRHKDEEIVLHELPGQKDITVEWQKRVDGVTGLMIVVSSDKTQEKLVRDCLAAIRDVTLIYDTLPILVVANKQDSFVATKSNLEEMKELMQGFVKNGFNRPIEYMATSAYKLETLYNAIDWLVKKM